jgi:PAS domain S-box-containing protein
MEPSQANPHADRPILVVEDEPVQALKLQGIFEERGFQVTVAGDGVEALEILERQPMAVVLSDVVMPRLDGYDLCARIRADKRFTGTLVILLTSHADPGDTMRALATGADTFVSKPYDTRELLDAVTRLLSADAHAAGDGEESRPVLRYGGEEYPVRATREQILQFFLSAYSGFVRWQGEVTRAHGELRQLADTLERRVQERTAELRGQVEERMRLEEESRQRAALLELARDAILVCALDGMVQFWNRSAERLYGWSAVEAVGMPVAHLLPGPLQEGLAAVLGHLLADGEWTGEVQQITRTGKPLVVLSSCTLLRDPSGRPQAVLIINTDITDRKQLEAQFLRAQRLESIGVLAGGIAHDLNNLLAPILLSVGIMRNAFPDAKFEGMIALVEASAQRAAEMVKQVLTFARGVEGERVILQPTHLIREIQRIAEQSFPKSIEFGVVCPRDLKVVLGDATQLHQVLMNLCVNARDAMPAGGTLTIAAENVDLDEQYAAMNPEARPGPYVLLRVTDSGAGMSPEVLGKIFEPFFTTKEVGKGTGLGLSTSMAVVRSHGGFLHVSSEPGRGTEFRVYLPAHASNAVEGTGADASEPLPGNGETVLVVDDERIIREITRATLEGHGYQVVMAGDGTEALAQYAEHRHEIRAVLLDMIMPFLDGPGTIRALRRMNPELPIIGVSGMTETAKAAESALKGKIPFLPKPYTTEKLLEVLSDILHPATEQPQVVSEEVA